jgi:hypothetical protein
MILRRKFSPFMTAEMPSIVTTPARTLRWFEDFFRTHKHAARLGLPIVRLLGGDAHEAEEGVRMHGLVRLRKGQLSRVRLGPAGTIKMRLAHYSFSLTNAETPLLEDQLGQTYRLHPGKNYVGSHGDDIRVDPHFDQISALHVIIETDQAGDLLFTDLSERGTYIPPQCVL